MPFVLAAGYPPELLADPVPRDAPVLRKPYVREELTRALARVVGR